MNFSKFNFKYRSHRRNEYKRVEIKKRRNKNVFDASSTSLRTKWIQESGRKKRRNKNVFDTSSTSLRNYNLIRGGEDFTDATLKESINRYFQRIYQRDKIEILKRFTISQERTSILICWWIFVSAKVWVYRCENTFRWESVDFLIIL